MEEEEEEVNAKTSSSPEIFSALHEDDDDNEKPIGGRRQHQLLSNLLSELESMEEKVNNVTEEAKQKTKAEDTQLDEKEVSNNEEIIKELRKIKRQNTMTHWLVSAMIVLTLAWQLSEVSLILKIKDGLSNPLKTVGGIIGGFLGNRRRQVSINVQDVIKQVTEKQKQVIEPTCLPGLKIPELPHLGLPGFDKSDDDDHHHH